MSTSPEPAARAQSAPPGEAADAQLAARILRGEHAAARDLLDAHLTPLYQFVHFRIGRDRGLVEDVVQDTFLTALQTLGAWEGRSDLRGWLVGIARNKIRAARRQRAPRALEDALAESDAEIDAILADVAREPLPDQVLERRETSELVGAALSALPADYQQALLAKYVEGHSTRELARAGGQSEKAAESRLTRARVAFARVFELLARKRGGLA
ncbi:MAG: RNA polymerase sigma factor [Planctomycetes bacterium]|nr:RNA polymerase sigma factor [Planctomycetota bacterium]